MYSWDCKNFMNKYNSPIFKGDLPNLNTMYYKFQNSNQEYPGWGPVKFMWKLCNISFNFIKMCVEYTWNAIKDIYTDYEDFMVSINLDFLVFYENIADWISSKIS